MKLSHERYNVLKTASSSETGLARLSNCFQDVVPSSSSSRGDPASNRSMAAINFRPLAAAVRKLLDRSALDLTTALLMVPSQRKLGALLPSSSVLVVSSEEFEAGWRQACGCILDGDLVFSSNKAS